MRILAFDTSDSDCSFALCDAGEIIAEGAAFLQKDMAERLFFELSGVLRSGGFSWQDLDAIAVCEGPGNFTGLRIGISAARGLALGLNIPAVGVALDAARAFDSGNLGADSGGSVARTIALIAGDLLANGDDLPPPKPLYSRPPDAALPKESAPVILSE